MTTTMTPSRRKSAPVTAKKSAMKKGRQDGKPKLRRALTAYNLFTAFERERILNGTDQLGLPATVADAQRISAQQKARKRRQHRKSHGKISFQELSRRIAERWKKLPEAERKVFEQQALVEKMEREAKLRQMEQGEAGNEPFCESEEESSGSVLRRSISPTQSETSFSSRSLSMAPVAATTQVRATPSSSPQSPAVTAQSLAQMTKQLQASLGLQALDVSTLTQKILVALASSPQQQPASSPNLWQGLGQQQQQPTTPAPRLTQARNDGSPKQSQAITIELDSEEESSATQGDVVKPDPLDFLDDFPMEEKSPNAVSPDPKPEVEVEELDIFDDKAISDMIEANKNMMDDIEEPLAANSLDFDLTEPLVHVDCTI
eukprot:CAMPEP_0168781688 /NCGR_PEP_ID=MMETSP0725-20121227/8765_1 /TAXON_ID=265536 /ORGANISM="Amphiprora sp., Strain CCMP467" /LENGTH=374 /DNA_ID=CAMNT_0008831573 /DNA_START=29 /DNA_END=1153 /DNA_ORIENTATION=+